MKGCKTVRRIMDQVLGGVSAFLFAFMTIVGTYQILVRYLFNRPSTVSEELLTYSFTWMSLLAAAYVFGKREHMRMGFLSDRIKGTGGRLLEIGIELIIALFSAVVLVYGGTQITLLTMTQRTASLGIPMGYVYLVVPVCGILILIYNILNLADMFYRERGGTKS